MAIKYIRKNRERVVVNGLIIKNNGEPLLVYHDTRAKTQYASSEEKDNCVITSFDANSTLEEIAKHTLAD